MTEALKQAEAILKAAEDFLRFRSIGMTRGPIDADDRAFIQSLPVNERSGLINWPHDAIALALIEKHRALEACRADLERQTARADECGKIAVDVTAELDSLRARLAQLESILAEAREALGPFAREAKEWADRTDLADDYEIIDRESCAVMFRLGDLRRAATVSAKIVAMDAALKEKTDEA